MSVSGRPPTPPRSPHTIDSPNRSHYPGTSHSFPFPPENGRNYNLHPSNPASYASSTPNSNHSRSFSVGAGVSVASIMNSLPFVGGGGGRHGSSSGSGSGGYSLGIGMPGSNGVDGGDDHSLQHSGLGSGSSGSGSGSGSGGTTSPFSPALRKSFSHASQSRGLRFSRREIMLCCVTFLVSWLLFHNGDVSEHQEAGQVEQLSSSAGLGSSGPTTASNSNWGFAAGEGRTGWAGGQQGQGDGLNSNLRDNPTGYEDETDMASKSRGWKISGFSRPKWGGWFGAGGEGSYRHDGESSRGSCSSVLGSDESGRKSYTKSVEKVSLGIAMSLTAWTFCSSFPFSLDLRGRRETDRWTGGFFFFFFSLY